jgi:hypothetical protein
MINSIVANDPELDLCESRRYGLISVSLLINPSAERMTDRTGSFRLLEALDLLNVSHQDTRKRLPHNAVNDDLYKYSEGISKKHNWG